MATGEVQKDSNIPHPFGINGEKVEVLLIRVGRLTEMDALFWRDFGKEGQNLMNTPAYTEAVSQLSESMIADPQPAIDTSYAHLSSAALVFGREVAEVAYRMLGITANALRYTDRLDPVNLNVLLSPAKKVNLLPLEVPPAKPPMPSFLPLSS